MKTKPQPTNTQALLAGIDSFNALVNQLINDNPKLRNAAIARTQAVTNANMAKISPLFNKAAQAVAIKAKRAALATYRDRLRKAKADTTARVFTLVVKNGNGKKIRALRELTWREAHKQQRDWYKIMRLTMKLDIGLSIEFEEQGAA